MTLTFNVFGLEVARIELAVEDGLLRQAAASPNLDIERPSLLNRGVKAMSGFWVDRMMR